MNKAPDWVKRPSDVMEWLLLLALSGNNSVVKRVVRSLYVQNCVPAGRR